MDIAYKQPMTKNDYNKFVIINVSVNVSVNVSETVAQEKIGLFIFCFTRPSSSLQSHKTSQGARLLAVTWVYLLSVNSLFVLSYGSRET